MSDQIITTENVKEVNPDKFAFYYLLSLVALVFMSISTGMIIFQIINKKIADTLSITPGVFDPNAVKFAISAIIIAAPIYYVTVFLINKSLVKGELDKDSGVRRWLTYFILLVSSVVMIGWFIATINNFLNGDFTVKFILKAVSAILIAASIFAYYLYDIKREIAADKKDKVVCAFFYVSLVIVLTFLVSAFFFIESPAVTRDRREDSLRLDKFSRIDSAINAYYNENKRLPAKFGDIIGVKTSSNLVEDDAKDPVSKTAFDYKVTGKYTYELCANFKTSNKNQNNQANYYEYNERWPHDAGYQCLGQRLYVDPANITTVPVKK